MKRILNFLLQAGPVIKALLKKYWEYINIIVTVFLMVKTPGAIRSIDATAAPIDPGVLSAIVMGILTLMIAKSVTWLLINTVWSVFAEYGKNDFVNDFKALLPWQRNTIFLLVYFSIAAFFLFSVKIYL